MRLEPQIPGYDSRINPGVSPPCGFVVAAVDFAMVPPTQGTVNSSLTLHPSARVWANRRWWASEGCRPQIKQGRLATDLTCSRLRIRRGSGRASKLLSISFVPRLVLASSCSRGLRRAAAGRSGPVSGSSAGETARVASFAWQRPLTSDQIRAARALVRWRAEDLARASTVGVATKPC